MLNPRQPHASLRDKDPFSSRDAWRPLRLIVDDKSVVEREVASLLDIARPAVAVVHHTSGRWAPFKVRVEPPQPGRDYVAFNVGDPSGDYTTGVVSAAHVERQAREIARRRGRPFKEVFALLAFAELCRKTPTIDRFVTADPLVAQEPSCFYDALHPRAGLALLGLALRATGDYTISRHKGSATYLRADAFHTAAAFGLLGDTERCFAAVLRAWDGGAPKPYTLLQGTIARLARALRARDLLQIRLRAVDFDAVWRDALLFVDALLVSLMGALDACARLVHAVYSLKQHERTRVSWQQRDWRRALVAEEPEFGDLFSNVLTNVLQIVGGLRNSVHEAPLSEELHGWDEGPRWTSFGEGVIALPHDVEGRTIRDAARRDGGELKWGIVDRADLGAVFVNPGLLAERAVRRVAEGVRQIFALMNWGRLGEEDTAVGDLRRWVPNALNQRSAFLLSGLGDPGYWVDRMTA